MKNIGVERDVYLRGLKELGYRFHLIEKTGLKPAQAQDMKKGENIALLPEGYSR